MKPVNPLIRRILFGTVAAACLAAAGAGHGASQVETVASGFATATALGVDADGNVFVGEGDQGGSNSVARVRKFNPSGSQTLQFGAPGNGNGQFNLPYAIAFDASGNVYVAENYGNRLQKFDAAGNYVATLASYGTGCADLKLEQAAGVAVSGSSVFVSSQSGHCVQKISTSGAFQTKWGSNGSGAGQFGGPSAVAVDSAGHVYVADTSRVQKFDANGTFLLAWAGSNGGYGMAIDRSDNIYVAQDGDSCRKIEKRSTSGVLLGSECSSRFIGSGGANTKLATDSSGRLYISNGAAVVRVDMSEPTASLTGPTSPILTGAEVRFDASDSNVPFGAIAKFEWDLDGDGAFERDTGTSSTLTTGLTGAGARTVSVRVTAPSGKTATASVPVETRPAPPEGEPGITINDASPYTNDRNVTLSVVWPPFATKARISNDGGFRASTTVTRDLAPTYDWQLDDSVKALYTKVVYVRFSGSGIDETKTYTDDIILDLTPPTIQSATATRLAGAAENAKKKGQPVRVRTKAKDNRSGVGFMQITSTKAKPGKALAYARSRTVRVTGSRVFVRVQDRAGNWSKWRTLRVAR